MNFEFDLWLRYMDDLSTTDVDSYCMIDARLGWKPKPSIELSIAEQNIFDNRHQEFFETFLNYGKLEVERIYHFKATWFF